MAVLGCLCGEWLSNSNDLTCDQVYICREKDVQEAVKYNPEMEWVDFKYGWDEITKIHRKFRQSIANIDYWYCSRCHRIYQCYDDTYNVMRVFRRINDCPRIPEEELEPLIIVSDFEELVYDEIYNNLTLDIMAHKVPHKYNGMWSAKDMTALIYDIDHHFLFAYIVDDYDTMIMTAPRKS